MLKGKKIGLLILFLYLLTQDGEAQEFQDLDAFLQEQTRRFHLPGASLTIVKEDSIIFSKGYGEGITPDRPYFIGSLSKALTATAVMQLIEKGKLKLGDPVSQLLPEVSFRGPGIEDLNVEHLLRHRSGLVRKQGFLPLPSLVQMKETNFPLNLHFVPGTREAYSNLNYSLLGLIVERISGMSFADYMNVYLFQPLDMLSSTAGIPEDNQVNKAQGYRFWYGFPFQAGKERYIETAIPAGFMLSSTKEIGHFLIAQLQYGRYGSQEILSPEGIARMHEPGPEDGASRGIGWSLGAWNGSPIWQHSGATGTSYAYMAVLPEKNTAFIFLTNINAFNPIINSIEEIPKGIFQHLDGRTPNPALPLNVYLLRLFGLILFLSLFDLVIKVVKWIRAGRPMDSGNSRADLLKLIFWKLILPVGLIGAALAYFEISLNAVLRLHPDIGWAIVISVFAGFINGFLEHYIKVKNQNT